MNCGHLCFFMSYAVIDWTFVIHCYNASDVSMGICKGTGQMYVQTEQ